MTKETFKMKQKLTPKEQKIYIELLEEYKDNKATLHLIQEWAKRDSTDWEKAKQTLDSL